MLLNDLSFCLFILIDLANILYCKALWLLQIFFNSLLFCNTQFPSRVFSLSLLSTLLLFLFLLQITPFNCYSCEAGQLLIIWLCVFNRAIIKLNKHIFCRTLKTNNYLIISRSHNPPLNCKCFLCGFFFFTSRKQEMLI